MFLRRRGKRFGWRLTNAVDWKIRHLLGLRGWSEMMTGLVALREHHDIGTDRIPETWLCGADGWGTSDGAGLRVALEAMLMPALVRGLVTSWSDLRGRVSYRLSAAGREYLDSPTLPPVALPAYDEAAADLYDEAVESARLELAAATPTRENVSVVPASCGLWPSDADRAPIPYCLTTRGEPRTLPKMIEAILQNVAEQEKTARA
jgi:hypothetical protein